MAVLRKCVAGAVAMPWQCLAELSNDSAVVRPWHCHGSAVALPWLGHGNDMAVPWLPHGCVWVMPWPGWQSLAVTWRSVRSWRMPIKLNGLASVLRALLQSLGVFTNLGHSLVCLHEQQIDCECLCAQANPWKAFTPSPCSSISKR